MVNIIEHKLLKINEDTIYEILFNKDYQSLLGHSRKQLMMRFEGRVIGKQKKGGTHRLLQIDHNLFVHVGWGVIDHSDGFLITELIDLGMSYKQLSDFLNEKGISYTVKKNETGVEDNKVLWIEKVQLVFSRPTPKDELYLFTMSVVYYRDTIEILDHLMVSQP